ncbi:MAG: DUF523 domain-containing protein [Zetaproteobacteria bacterium CG12_big_fil_rev_8_21_14_0_65_55_1124]|nr:MAG: purine-nucleoside phosphorylase [Zetaproteobacteria bacterium CG1_02_55_237]PIS20281.1 MAG: DUF523 domain-containing protein [Zetaproteobacteria bacterium CG08_land_8_20_14_0_20_55_17]PIW43157.1 MAG: DUF523 domain-containing protein [Zetaproteobacteria bacterium CG12_big_fil_rev_8_21_14_0_65_55_1124]PIY52122.1 MAG: DUF523 domain-containing protein [Zetaproteobacteria bacterium CG_4_10_14_0_8_um_filter_55_43]PIZ38134.1 MAG: DUF523 domain-containing protein [Zetaproteobacteria bacterium C
MQKILVSACLLGEKVRYDGGDSAVQGLLDTWNKQGRIISLCPEVAGGLCVPREPAEIVAIDANNVLRGMGRVQKRDGGDVTDAFLDGAERALAQCWEHKIKIAILKEGSPSCGSSRINDGKFSGNKISGQGITTALLTGHGISVFSEDQLDDAARRLAELESK